MVSAFGRAARPHTSPRLGQQRIALFSAPSGGMRSRIPVRVAPFPEEAFAWEENREATPPRKIVLARQGVEHRRERRGVTQRDIDVLEGDHAHGAGSAARIRVDQDIQPAPHSEQQITPVAEYDR